MSLRAIAEAAGLSTGIAQTTRPNINTALAFVLNADFVKGLKILCYSLIMHNSFVDVPIIIFSEDNNVTKDPFVSALADKIIKIGEDDIAQFNKIPAHEVDARSRLDWIPKYTLLKWMIFEDYGFDQIIFFDSDIICLGDVSDLADMRDAELYAAHVFEPKLYTAEDGSQLTLPERTVNILEFSRKTSFSDDCLNTGVLVINKPLLTNVFREQLIKVATGKFRNEQTAVRRTMQSRPPGSLLLISPLYNYNHGYIRRISAHKQIGLRAEIKLLHYVGADKKPWHPDANVTLTEQLWIAHARQAAARSRLFV